jgi:hypothetical protein
VLPPGITDLSITIPCDIALVGLSVPVQVLEGDPTAPGGVAASRALLLTVGL